MRDLGLLLFRLIIGGIFVAHGYPKLFGGPGKPVSATARRRLGEGFAQSMERGGPANVQALVQTLEIPQPQILGWVGVTIR